MTSLAPYQDFLTSKFKFTQAFGFELSPSEVHPLLKPHQNDLVCWAVRRGRAAIFAAFGLGKSLIQIEVLRAIMRHEGGRLLVIAPLGVRMEFIRDAAMVGITFKFIRTSAEATGDGFYLTNYESVRDGKLDVDLFIAISLDEASVLRSYGSKTYQEFLTMFGDVKYRFVATATPSPNRHKELIHYAGFLGIMDTGQALTRFFQRDSTQANNLTLYPHMEAEFYTWMHSWAIFIQTPSDLGYSDEGYALPEMEVRYHEVSVKNLGGKVDRDGQIQLVNDAALGLKDAAEEKRNSIGERVAKVAELIAGDPDSHFIIWHDLEDERRAINAAIPACLDVYGSQDMEQREQRIMDFSDGKFHYLSTKPEIAGSGCNFQRHCHRAIFSGIGYKFNDFIQAIYRIQRFQQDHPVIIDIVYTETERAILTELKRKWAEDTELRKRMSTIIRKYGLSTAGMEDELRRTIGIERKVERGECFEVANNDCCDETARMEENSVDLIHTSIPFGNHYEYSASYNDFGHNEDNAKFFDQMDYLTPELLRVLRPGRVAAIHVKDRIRFGNVTGYGFPTMDPFHCECVAHYLKHGFKIIGMITVVTDVVRENNQTYRLGWSEQCKDGSKMGVGSPEYILLFRKLPSDTSTAYADIRVEKSKADYTRARWQVDAHAFWRSSGNRLLAPDEFAELPVDQIGRAFERASLERVYDHEEHIALGEALDERGVLPATFMILAPGSHNDEVWHDVNRMRTLNGDQTQRGLTNHICPLQFDIVDRIIRRYTNEGEVVYDPFGGIMTVPYRAIKLGRRGRAAELNVEYFRDGVRYLREIELRRNAPSLFDALAETQEVLA
ncbi:MAG TPA: DNA methyltransferase [Edaphobacter sp.]|nr:DNA methyltransferase [Edaphobacter sp.]